MLFATVGQGALFLWMMAAGAAVGLWYALLATLRRFIQAGFYLTLVCDLAFGIGSAVILIAFLVSGNYGRVRLFEIVAALLGALIFALAASPPLKGLENALRRTFRRIKASMSGNRLLKVIFK